MIDYTKAATLATETLIKYAVTTAPISPLPILEKMDNVVVVSFADISESSGMRYRELVPVFGKNLDAVSSVSTESGMTRYIVAYNSFLPVNMVQRALAREMGHIVLGHKGFSDENNSEALCFAYHLLCPRPLIHALEASCLRVTKDLLANITGVFDQTLTAMRKIPSTDVPATLNRFVRNQFTPFILNFFEFYQTVLHGDGSATADFGNFMGGYVE